MFKDKVRRTDKVRPANTRQNIDKVRPANTAKYIDKIRTTKKSTKFALQIQCNYSTKISFKFALQMQRYQ